MNDSGTVATVDVIKKCMALTGRLQPEDHITALQTLPAELQAIQDLNPTFNYLLEVQGPFDIFRRLTVVMPHAKEACNYTFKVYGLDGAHTDAIVVQKNPRTIMKQNTLLAVTSRMPNNNITLLAFTICYSENIEDVTHLFDACIAVGLPLNEPDASIISDRSAALAAGLAAVTPQAYHARCPKHLERNLSSFFGELGEKVLPKHYHESARTSTWQRMFDECSSFTGQYPNSQDIAAIGADDIENNVARVQVKAWLEEDAVTSTAAQRFRSRGDSAAGGGVTIKRQSKKNKRACFHCTKLVSGFTRHPATACVVYRKWCQMETAKENRLCFTFNAAALTQQITYK